ncbi:MAG: HPr family phosphocarrier protein [Lachnospiraceae bacterium]|nr:HPr family phosphocarrier protein [Lachnospiraceae bacterium]
MSRDVQIKLNNNRDIVTFNKIIERFDTDFDLASGRSLVDAKSILGIFYLDTSRPVTLTIHDTDQMDEILEAISPFITDEVAGADR